MADMTKRAPAETKQISRLSLAQAAFGAAQELRQTSHRETWESCGPWVRDAHLAAVDAILAQIREPDDRMRRIMAEQFGFKPNEPVGQAEAVRLSFWQRVIDAIE